MYWKELEKDIFFKNIKNIHFKHKDNIESMEYGYKNVKDLFKDLYYCDFCRFFVVKDDEFIYAAITLDRCGNISFFTTKNLVADKAIKFVRTIKNLIDWYLINYETTLFVTTANWYKEAIKLNKLLGFEKYKEYHNKTKWVIKGNK